MSPDSSGKTNHVWWRNLWADFGNLWIKNCSVQVRNNRIFLPKLWRTYSEWFVQRKGRTGVTFDFRSTFWASDEHRELFSSKYWVQEDRCFYLSVLHKVPAFYSIYFKTIYLWGKLIQLDLIAVTSWWIKAGPVLIIGVGVSLWHVVQWSVSSPVICNNSHLVKYLYFCKLNKQCVDWLFSASLRLHGIHLCKKGTDWNDVLGALRVSKAIFVITTIINNVWLILN